MSSSELDRNCTLLIHRSYHHYIECHENFNNFSFMPKNVSIEEVSANLNQPPNLSELQKRLEKGDNLVKYQALKEIIVWTLQPALLETVSSSTKEHDLNLASKLLMHIIRFVLPCTDHKVKKMVQIYFEIVNKTKSDGTTLKEEMILVCNKLREDLLHPNEYIRGSTLRLLCKIKHIKILEPLIESIFQNLTHSHAYVRRNAIMCINSAFSTFGLDLLPNAAIEVENLLNIEPDFSTRRNAFLMLINCDLRKAIQYAMSIQANITCVGDMFQLAFLLLLRKVSKHNPAIVTSLLRIIMNLVVSCSPAVAYEGASILLALSFSPLALKAAAKAYVGLLRSQSENNVKLIVLDRIQEIAHVHRQAAEKFVVDILRCLKSPSLAIKRKALSMGLQLVSRNSVEYVVNILKRELRETVCMDHRILHDSFENTLIYQTILIRGLRRAIKSDERCVASLLDLLFSIVPSKELTTALAVAKFIRDIMVSYKDSRNFLITKLASYIPSVAHPSVVKIYIWVLGEYSSDAESIELCLNAIFSSISPLWIPTSCKETALSTLSFVEQNAVPDTPIDIARFEERKSKKSVSGDCETFLDRKRSSLFSDSKAPVNVLTRTIVLSDGTYGTKDIYYSQNSIVDNDLESSHDVPFEAYDLSQNVTRKKTGSYSLFRSHIVSGDLLLCTTTAVAVVKLVFKIFGNSFDWDDKRIQDMYAKGLLIVGSIFYVLSENKKIGGPKSDSAIRVNQAFKSLLNVKSIGYSGITQKTSFDNVKANITRYLNLFCPSGNKITSASIIESEEEFDEEEEAEGDTSFNQGDSNDNASSDFGLGTCRHECKTDNSPFSFICFRQLNRDGRCCVSRDKLQDIEEDMKKALGTHKSSDNYSTYKTRLWRVKPLTGLSDSIYVEAFFEVNQYDLRLELSVTNRTETILQNVFIELCTHGEVKILERPPIITLTIGETRIIHASIKVKAAEKGFIFGHISYDMPGSPETEYLFLNQLHLNLSDFIQKQYIGESRFRSMWAEFEWENKVIINTSIRDVVAYIEMLMRHTNMTLVGDYTARQHFRTPSLDTPGVQQLKRGELSCLDANEDELRKFLLQKKVSLSLSVCSINLYSKSIFGEDALANVSIEKTPDGSLTGHVRIRSICQGIALSLGDRITDIQRGTICT